MSLCVPDWVYVHHTHMNLRKLSSSVFSVHIRTIITSFISSSRDPMASSGLHRHLNLHVHMSKTDRQTDTHTNTNLKKIKKQFISLVCQCHFLSSLTNNKVCVCVRVRTCACVPKNCFKVNFFMTLHRCLVYTPISYTHPGSCNNFSDKESWWVRQFETDS